MWRGMRAKEAAKMNIVRLMYVSMMTEDCDMDALQDILDASRRNNAELGITGMLCYDPAFFFQCLEGPGDAVRELYARIHEDPRHKNVKLIEERDTDRRFFGEWSMAFVKASEVDKQTIAKYCPNAKFDPYTFDADTALRFLCALAETKRKQVGA